MNKFPAKFIIKPSSSAELTFGSTTLNLKLDIDQKENLKGIQLLSDQLDCANIHDQLKPFFEHNISSLYESGLDSVPTFVSITFQRAIEDYWGTLKVLTSSENSLLCRCVGTSKSDFQDAYKKEKADFKKTCAFLNAGMICTSCRGDLKAFSSSLPNLKYFLDGKSQVEWLDILDAELKLLLKADKYNITSFDLSILKIKIPNYSGELARKELNLLLGQEIKSKLDVDLKISVFF